MNDRKKQYEKIFKQIEKLVKNKYKWEYELMMYSFTELNIYQKLKSNIRRRLKLNIAELLEMGSREIEMMNDQDISEFEEHMKYLNKRVIS